MFRSKTLFVVAAGASKELGLPIGSELKSQIASTLQQDHATDSLFVDTVISSSILHYLQNNQVAPGSRVDPFQKLLKDAHHLASNMPLAPSIDNFLNTHRDNVNIVTLGKVSIARCILRAENKSHLYSRDHGIYSLPLKNGDFTSAWHVLLWQQLNSEITVDNVDAIFENVSFVVFNYDRCLEHFLYLSLCTYYNLPPDHAAQIMKSANIVHPYGKIGGLPWETDTIKVEFGSSNTLRLYDVAMELRTFTESTDEGIVREIKNMVRAAESIVMLGFGFLDQNIDLLAIGTGVKRAFMTAYATSPSDAAMAIKRVGQMVGKEAVRYDTHRDEHNYEAHVVHGECRQLFADHRLRLTSQVI